MNAKHTPGTLYELEPQSNGERRWSLVTTGPIAYLTCDEPTARAIADAYNAFPDLLAVCEMLVAHAGPDDTHNKFVNAARAAIAKAGAK